MKYRSPKRLKEKGMTVEIEPYFRFHIAKYGLRQGIFTIRILILSFSVHFLYGAGWSISPVMGKWFCGLWIHLDRIVVIPKIGLDLNIFLFLEIERLERKLWPERKGNIDAL